MSNGPYWVGDVPATDLVVVPSRGGEDLDLSRYLDVTVALFDPDGVPMPSDGFTAALEREAGEVVIEWPSDPNATTRTTHDWDGAPGLSSSTRLVGTTVSRNESVNPVAAAGTWRANNNAAAIATQVTLPSSPPGTNIKTGTMGQSVSTWPALLSVYDIDGLGPAPSVAARSAGVWVLVNADGYTAKIGTAGNSTPLTPNVWTFVRSQAAQAGASGGSLFVNSRGVPAASDRAWATGSITAYAADAPPAYFDGDTRDTFTTTPGESVLTAPGVYTLVLALLTERGGLERADSLTFVVQADDGWHTLESIRNEWTDAPSDDASLAALLESAKTQCIDYAPALGERRPPANYRQAQLLQARNLWQSVKADDGGQLGADGYAVPVYSMDWVVKGLLRPKRGTPIAG